MLRPALCLWALLATAASAVAQPWYDMMTGPRPNLFEVSRAYDAWYRDHPFVKNGRTQDYKRWVRHMELYADAQGYERRPTWTLNDDAAFLSTPRRKEHETSQALSVWRGIGPFGWDKQAAGLSYAPGLAHCYVVKEDPRDAAVIWAGTATAGLWKSTDSARSWTNVTASMLVREVRALCIDANRSGRTWFGASTGVWRTVDGGRSWTQTALQGSFFTDLVVYDILQIRGMPEALVVATNKGLHRSLDAGTTFDLIQQGTFYELEQHPTNDQTIYAVRRDGEGCAFIKSRDAGASFQLAGQGLPIPNTANKEHTRRWEIAVTPAAPARVYLLAAGAMNGGEGLVGVYVSTDEGLTFVHRCCGDGPGGTYTPTNPNILAWQPDGQENGGQYYYDLALAVSPVDPERVYVGGINVWVSTDGGRNFSCNAKWTYEPQYRRRYTHADVHEIFTVGRRVWVASDGGVFHSPFDMDSTEDRTTGIQGTEFWGWDAGFTDCNVMVGGTYHNGVLVKDKDTYAGWLHIYGGDNGGGLVNYGDDRTIYADRYLAQPWERITLSGNARIAPEKQDMGIAPTSNIALHPWCNTEMWAGTAAGLLRSTDHGRTWTTIVAFGDTLVRRIRIMERDPKVMVLLAKKDTYSAVSVRRTTDGGASFADITPPSTLTGGDGWRVNDLAVDDEDPDRMWLTLGGFRPGVKVLRTTDGGATWLDHTGSLPEPAVTSIVHQRGSNGLVYIGTQLGVYVRDETMADWQLFGDSLPVAHVTTFDICYRDGLLRAATNRGVFETRLHVTSKPQALISVDQRVVLCTRDTVTYHDHSVADGSTVRRQWTFEGGTPETSTAAHPSVTYAAPGSYRVRLVVTDAFGTDMHVVDSLVTVLSTCNPDDVAGNALHCNGTDGVAVMRPLRRRMSHATISAWIRTQGKQQDWAGLVFARGSGTVAGLSIMADNTIRYHWGDRGWSNVAPMTIPDMKWTHVALVITPDSSVVYVNGRGTTFRTANVDQGFLCDLNIGRDPTSTTRYFRGQIDEVRIYARALTRDELRESMHRTNASVTDLVAYYQFNEDGIAVIDRHGDHHGALSTSARREASAAPVGRGTATTTHVDRGGRHDWSGTGVSLQWLGNADVPDGDVVVTRLRQASVTLPQGVERTLPDGLIIMHSYGSGTFDRPLNITVDDIRIQPNEATRPADLVLYRRAWHGDTAWSDPIGIATEATPGLKGNIVFMGGNLFTTSSQLVVGSRQTVGVGVADTDAAPRPHIAPNPVHNTLKVKVGGIGRIEIFDLTGRLLLRQDVTDASIVDVAPLHAGTYMARITGDGIQYAEVLVKQ